MTTTTFVAVPAQTFAVDLDGRTIEGMVVPYGAVGEKGGMRFRFARGSVRWGDVSRVKLLRDHDVTRPVGKAVSLVDAGAGVRARFKVAAGASGDEALGLSADGVLDGLSVGVEFGGEDYDPDPMNRGVMLVRRADLREVSLTAMPAFDDARVTRVAASREMTVTDIETTEPAGDDAGEAMYTLEQLARVRALFGSTAVQGPDPVEGPTPVNPAHSLRTLTASADVPRDNPLAYTPEALAGLGEAFATRSAGSFEGASRHEFATLVTGTHGAPRAWSRNVLSGPRLLHVAGRAPTESIDAILASFPSLTLPTATASVGEGITLTEYATSTAGTVTAARFGRWTDFAEEALIGTSPDAVVGMHQIGIALDLDTVLVNAVETAAGAAVAFSADVPATIRTSLATVQDATAAADVGDIVILVNPANMALLQDVAPIGGETMGEGFARFSGALVYPSAAVDTGFITVANLRVGVRYFESRGVETRTFEVQPKLGVSTVVTRIIAGYAITLTAGFARKNDVVTP